MEAYSLVSAKPKLKKADLGSRASCHEARTLANDPRDANPPLSQLLSCRNVTMAEFASRPQQIDDYRFVFPAEDATGIKGAWDFDLNFTPGERSNEARTGVVAPAPRNRTAPFRWPKRLPGNSGSDWRSANVCFLRL